MNDKVRNTPNTQGYFKVITNHKDPRYSLNKAAEVLWLPRTIFFKQQQLINSEKIGKST